MSFPRKMYRENIVPTNFLDKFGSKAYWDLSYKCRDSIDSPQTHEAVKLEQ